VLQVFHIT